MAARKPRTTRKSQAKADEPISDIQAAPTEGEAEPSTEVHQAKEGPSNAAESPPPAAEEAEKINTGEIPALFVRTKRRFKSRRRVGFRFTREGLGIALEALSAEEIAALKADPALEVEECTFPAEPDEAEQ